MAISWYDLHDFDPLRNELRQKTAMLQHPARLLKLLPGDCHGPLGLAMTRFWGTYSNPLNNHLPYNSSIFYHTINPGKSQTGQKRNRPRYSQDGATRAEVQLRQKLDGGLLKAAAFFLSAVGSNMNRLAEIQTEHAHKTLGIDQGAVVTHHHAEGLDSGNLHKILDFIKGM